MNTTNEHIYLIRNKKTKEISFKNNNTACFFEWNEYLKREDEEKILIPFKKEEELIFFYPIESLGVDESIIKIIYKTVKEFIKIGCPLNAEIINYKGEFDHDKLNHYENTNIFMFSIDLEKCKTRGMSTFILHITRFLWDWGGPYFLKRVWEYKEKQKCTFWQAFIICHKFEACEFTSHPVYYNYILFKIPTQKQIKEKVRLLKKENVNKHKMNFVFDDFIINNLSRSYATMETTVKQYKEFK